MKPAATPAHSVSRTVRLLGVALAAVLLVAGCSSGGDSKKPGAKGAGPGQSSAPAAPPPPKVTMNPAAGASGVAPASPVTVEIAEGKLATVSVKSTSGDVVDGAVDAAGTHWASKGKLSFGASYAVQVTTDTVTAPVTVGEFKTAPAPGSGGGVRTSSVLGDHKTYGVAMPIILKLSTSLSTKAERAAFEKSLSVQATPATAGAWGWINGKELHFRPKAFWATGSKVHVVVDAAGRQLDDKWGRNDLTLDFTIGVRREMRADSKTHTMRVIENGKVVKSMLVSLGKPKYPSSSGTMVVIEKAPKAMFDSSTYGLPVDAPGGYRTEVQFPIRFTWGGQFIHSAPWSVHQQGHVNVSHGCINVAPADAKWIFDRIAVGDPVIVTNTEEPVKWADGWMEWSMSWAAWLGKSATGEQSAG